MHEYVFSVKFVVTMKHSDRNDVMCNAAPFYTHGFNGRSFLYILSSTALTIRQKTFRGCRYLLETPQEQMIRG